LLLNGQVIGERDVDPIDMVSFDAPYAPGRLEAVALRSVPQAPFAPGIGPAGPNAPVSFEIGNDIQAGSRQSGQRGVAASRVVRMGALR